jgi:hypothetical protein
MQGAQGPSHNALVNFLASANLLSEHFLVSPLEKSESTANMHILPRNFTFLIAPIRRTVTPIGCRIGRPSVIVSPPDYVLITDSQVDRMGAVYLKRLIASRCVIQNTPRRHLETSPPSCTKNNRTGADLRGMEMPFLLLPLTILEYFPS